MMLLDIRQFQYILQPYFQCIFVQPEDLHELMYEAILNNKTEFVQLFMEHGVALTEFLTIDRLLLLYNNVSIYPQSRIIHFR